MAGNTPIFLTPETIAAMIERQINPPEPMGLGGQAGDGKGTGTGKSGENSKDKIQDKKSGENDKMPAKSGKNEDKSEDKPGNKKADKKENGAADSTQKAIFTELSTFEYYAKNRIKKNELSGPLNRAS
jgi:hypothetical protein